MLYTTSITPLRGLGVLPLTHSVVITLFIDPRDEQTCLQYTLLSHLTDSETLQSRARAIRNANNTNIQPEEGKRCMLLPVSPNRKWKDTWVSTMTKKDLHQQGQQVVVMYSRRQKVKLLNMAVRTLGARHDCWNVYSVYSKAVGII